MTTPEEREILGELQRGESAGERWHFSRAGGEDDSPGDYNDHYFSPNWRDCRDCMRDNPFYPRTTRR